ncbi:hypothetical protein ACRE_039230 [Hapsidospora chrysogenum ATCC 11550]|uniref:Uncharacterized protein n=1 Tax=Hapsidospora chrysogenum (strain ATCC 11550 / CBS 779.69 / DSM 880 / IAM 14645 / JCM 23072 / IMI 49137) TaxID=857340 RepID=A0A086T7B1_HAPC1|nr:hypothetical protein ACRE_039230 [Hapsidospora chrysogenum ATCC 11550]
MKASFAVLSLLTALVAASPAPSEENVKRGLELVQRQTQCHDCIDRCDNIGGAADVACKVVFCSIQCVLTDG